MAGIKDAASMAAMDSLAGGGMPPMDPAMMGGMAPPEEQAPGGDIESALATIEASLAGAPPDKAEEARVHINALRDITASIGTEQAPPPEEELPPTGEPLPPTDEVQQP